MSTNGYDAESAIEALNSRVGAVEGEQIVEAARAKFRDNEMVKLHDALFQLRNEWRNRAEKMEAWLEAIAAKLGVL